MFVWGDGDVTIVQQSVQQCGRYVTGEYRIETLHGVSHWMLEEKPYAVADLLLDWITAHPEQRVVPFRQRENAGRCSLVPPSFGLSRWVSWHALICLRRFH